MTEENTVVGDPYLDHGTFKFCTQHRFFVDPKGGRDVLIANGTRRRWICAACYRRRIKDAKKGT